MKLEHKTFALKLDAPPDDEGRFTGYAAVFGNVDRGNDVIEAGAFKKSLQENPEVPILWAHNTDEPIGVSTMMVEDGKGLKVEGQLAMEVQRAREVHALMSLGAIKGLSIGYGTVKRTFKGAVRHLQELRLGEFSPVVFPMNELATVDAVKQYSEWEGADCGVGSLLSMIRSGTEFLLEEVAEGDTADAGRMQTILGSLAKLLASEISELAAEGSDATGSDMAPDVMYEEMMRANVEHATKSLEALLTFPEPAEATQGDAEAATSDAEPDVMSTLQRLQQAMRPAAT
jgi:HK97 family phage prohead protease